MDSTETKNKDTGRFDLSIGQCVLLYIMAISAAFFAIIRLYGLLAHTDNLVDVRFFASKALGVCLIIGMVFFHRCTPMKINWKGVNGTKEDRARSIKWGLLMAIVVAAVLFGYRLYLNTLSPENKEVPFFGLYLNMNTRWFYPINMTFQELFIKCFVQENIRKFFSGKHRHIAMFTTAAFFFILHVQYPFYYMVGAALLCAVTGYLYDRYPSIWGPYFVHFAIGFLPRCFGIFQIIE